MYVTCHIFISICLHVLVVCEFQVHSGKDFSHLETELWDLNEQIFPYNIRVNVSFTTIAGILLYSIDSDGNQFIIRVLNEYSPRFIVVFRNHETEIPMTTLCGCTQCKYTPLSLTVRITTAIFMRCNEGQNMTIVYNSIKSINRNFPKGKFEISNNKLKANLWLVNIPKEGSVFPNPEQMSGCIFEVEYNGKLLQMRKTGELISTGCNMTCQKWSCYDGICKDTYSGYFFCDCTYAFGNGQWCEDESISMDGRYTLSEPLSKMKVSWNTSSTAIFKLQHKYRNLTVLTQHNKLIMKYESNEQTVERLLIENYDSRRKYILIISFGKLLNFELVNFHNITIGIDLCGEMFDECVLASGADIVYKTNGSDYNWKKIAGKVFQKTVKFTKYATTTAIQSSTTSLPVSQFSYSTRNTAPSCVLPSRCLEVLCENNCGLLAKTNEFYLIFNFKDLRKDVMKIRMLTFSWIQLSNLTYTVFNMTFRNYSLLIWVNEHFQLISKFESPFITKEHIVCNGIFQFVRHDFFINFTDHGTYLRCNSTGWITYAFPLHSTLLEWITADLDQLDNCSSNNFTGYIKLSIQNGNMNPMSFVTMERFGKTWIKRKCENGGKMKEFPFLLVFSLVFGIVVLLIIVFVSICLSLKKNPIGRTTNATEIPLPPLPLPVAVQLDRYDVYEHPLNAENDHGYDYCDSPYVDEYVTVTKEIKNFIDGENVSKKPEI